MPMMQASDGTNLYVKQAGSGRPIVLIHGWPLTADSWDDQMLALSTAGFRVIAYDRRGFGRSDQPVSGYDYNRFADDLADVMAACDVERDATLIGFSMGGGEVARYLTRHGTSAVQSVGSDLVGRALYAKDRRQSRWCQSVGVRRDDQGDKGGPRRFPQILPQGFLRRRHDEQPGQRQRCSTGRGTWRCRRG